MLPVDVKDLTFFYDKTPILQGVNASIKQGEFVGIFGPNGGGKTTFLKLLMGFLKPSQGEILLFGKTPKSARLQIGYVPQLLRFDKQFPLSVLEVVLMGCLSKTNFWGGFSPQVKEKARAALDKVGLADKENAAFGTLSGGQAQRVLIARALVGDPTLLLLDEPTANVDVDAESAIYQLLLKLKGDMTILMVTHNLQNAVQNVDKFLCIHRKLTTFAPQDLCEHFALGLYHPPITQESLIKL